jgi:UDP-2,4-diacetamido-2,4,6-trideoxy-beta-L-altropyranose hydrolase
LKVVFRVDASIEMGIGHVMRCLTLAQTLKENRSNVEFICRKHIGNLIDKIRLSGFNVHELEEFEDAKADTGLAYSHWLGVTQQQDADDCIDILKAKKIDWLIVDHYALNIYWQKKIRPIVDKIMVIDDIADRQFDCNILLNQNLGAKKEDYRDKVPDNCQLLLGVKYILLRPEFLNLREKSLIERKNTKEIKNILVSIGGVDFKNITYKVLQNLDSDLDIVIVLGEKSPHSNIINNYVKNKANIGIIIDADNMSQLMLDADLAIGAGGSTSWERCCLGLPTLLYVIADNQNKIAKNLENIGAVKIVKNFSKDMQFATNISNWKMMSGASSKVCDGLGVKRVIEVMHEYCYFNK